MADYKILTPELVEEIDADESDQRWLFLEESDEYRGCWHVDGMTEEYFFDFEEIIGSHRLLTPNRLVDFTTICKNGEYIPVFIEDPISILDFYDGLNAEPTIDLNSAMPEADSHGFLPWQVQGFNKLIKSGLPASYVVWCTGAGKSAFIAAAIKYHLEYEPFDFALVAVKAHNKIDTNRKLKTMADIDGVIVDGDQRKRYKTYEHITDLLNVDYPTVVVTNYEKLRDDQEFFEFFVEGKRCLFFWDEMPTKLSNRTTQLYNSTKKVLYDKFPGKPRPKSMRHWALTATPIENDPDDVYSCVNLMSPRLLGTVAEFNSKHVAGVSPFSGKPNAWKNLDLMEAKLSFMTHRVVKDPSMFASVIPMDAGIDWGPQGKLYDKLTGKAADLIEELEDANVLSLIQIMQMVCDAPSMVIESAKNRDTFDEMIEIGQDPTGPSGSELAQMLLANIPDKMFTNKGHTKIDHWHEIIEKHHDSKILTFSAWGSYIFPIWKSLLQEWDIPYVLFDGTTKQKQDALDLFRDDPSIRVFLSGDAGSDSIDIPQANVVVNYNYPWKWTTLTQRVGRADRVNSNHDWIYQYDLVMADSVDERKKAIIDRKHGYHKVIFDGRVQDESHSASISRQDLIYMLTGRD